MLQDFSIAKSTRQCCVGHRPLEPGESYYSVVQPKGDDVVRVDIAETAWSEPPDAAIGWWKCRMPAAGVKKLRPAPTGVLLDTLSDLVERPGKEMLAYFLALLLVRRRVLADEEQVSLDLNHSDETSAAMSTTEVANGIGLDDASAMDTSGQPASEVEAAHIWSLVCPADGRQWNVPVVDPKADQILALEEELNQLLFTEE